ncbi:MAG: rRNA maturation RNase YbeY [Defluviitaleaceae bacterium]|nr:rRNA maturation RNase YbeY [Defluviitaleaceae bacterium]MCL2262941.1 rRNA maturation RNase YbeY [Defluviitaleaceae bacterium]
MKIHWDDRSPEPIPKSYRVTMKQAAIAALKRCFEMEDLRKLQYEVSISLVSDEEMRGLNKKYRDKDTPTDVLSFPTTDHPSQSDIFPMGDIVISTETAARQATANAQSLERELAFLTVHGTLHLLGLDHETSAHDDEIMNEIQDEIMGKL